MTRAAPDHGRYAHIDVTTGAFGADAAHVPVPDDSSAFALHVNGTSHSLTLDHRTTVLDMLREHLGLTGAKKGCG